MFTKLWKERPHGVRVKGTELATNGDICSFVTVDGRAKWVCTAADGSYSEICSFIQVGPWFFDYSPLPIGKRIVHHGGTPYRNHKKLLRNLYALEGK